MTKSTKKSEILRKWHLIDAKGQVLGRLATKIAPLLTGKAKPYFVKNLDCGDFVVVINAKGIIVSGKKEETKTYLSFSGYPSGMKVKKYSDVMAKSPEKIIGHAVLGMLPKNKQQADRIARLFVFPGEEHGYKEKFIVSVKKNEIKTIKKTSKVKTEEKE